MALRMQSGSCAAGCDCRAFGCGCAKWRSGCWAGALRPLCVKRIARRKATRLFLRSALAEKLLL